VIADVHLGGGQGGITGFRVNNRTEEINMFEELRSKLDFFRGSL
jgi:hypothetical protein